MNIWWFVILPLGLLWAVPMFEMAQINAPWWVFIVFSIFWAMLTVFAEPMYDWGTNIGRKSGHMRIVALRERWKNKVLPPARAALIIMAVISLYFAVYQSMSSL
ncbi:MAG: hypothetical protein GXO71_01685 [Caldiserica bacterium]|nr:hypothetical protein [Caldisericota bacterium]